MVGGVVIFGGVLEGVLDEFEDVVIGEGVVDVAAVAAASHEAFGAEEAEAVGDGRDAFAGALCELGDAGFARDEEIEGAQPSLVAQRAEESDRALDRFGAPDRGITPGVLVGRTGVGSVVGRGFVAHYDSCSSVGTTSTARVPRGARGGSRPGEIRPRRTAVGGGACDRPAR